MISKKATIGTMLSVIIALIIGLLVVSITYKLVLQPQLDSFFAQDSKESFNELTMTIISLSPTDSKQFNYFITQKNILVAFTPLVVPTGAITYAPTPDGQIQRPDQCPIDQTCICLCDAKLAIEQSCTTLDTICSPLKGITKIDGVSISEDTIKSKEPSGLYIKGRTKKLLQLTLEEQGYLRVSIVEPSQT